MIVEKPPIVRSMASPIGDVVLSPPMVDPFATPARPGLMRRFFVWLFFATIKAIAIYVAFMALILSSYLW